MRPIASVNRRAGVFFLFDRLFSVSGFLIFFIAQSFLFQKFSSIDGSYSSFQLEVYGSKMFVGVVLAIHFLYGIKWLQQVNLVKSFQSGFYYFSRRLTFVSALAFLVLIALSYVESVDAFLQTVVWLPLLIQFLFVTFIYYSGTSFFAFLTDWGIIVKKRNFFIWRALIVFLPSLIALFDFAQNHWALIGGLGL